ncbi:class I SAM-dependent methyltransferase [Marinomonas algicola]|uniref:class I SAM-dependent methyltransferase n=1 Tax=Marinomonas algicola TaxID=2773454 RepID=UPI00174D4030|nr:class I SAM-dependent methyltransferase [Marinomonas algicola]
MNFNPTSLLLDRVSDAFSGKVLFANPDDTYPLELGKQAEVYAWCQSKSIFDRLLRGGFNENHAEFNATWTQSTAETFDHIILIQPKAKELLDYLIDASMPHLKLGGKIWLVGDNKSGVKSSYKRLEKHAVNAGKVDGAKHCLVYNASKEEASPAFKFEKWITQWTQTVADQTFTLCSIPGVFGHKKLDKGTSLLLGQLSEHRFMSDAKQARFLDFGCGDGIIALWLHNKTGAKITALDDSALALKATELTFSANGVSDYVTTLASNGLEDVKGRFNYIVTNPPFHTGMSTDYSVAEGFFTSVKQHLTLNGELFVVANDFLRYPDFIDAALGTHTRLQRAQGFAIYYGKQKKPK